MGDKSAIEWTDATWNPVTGCTKISNGCKFCYAERITERWGQDFSKIILHPDRLDQPLRWKKPRRIFVNSMSDLFHEDIPNEFIERVFDSMLEAPQHIYQILTKRVERMQRWITAWLAPALTEKMLENIWLGISAEDQPRADERIPWLLQTPAAVRFLSLEPLLGPVDLRGCPSCGNFYRDGHDCETDNPTVPIDWVIIGCESGPQRRPMEQKWAEDIVEQCRAACVPVFMTQMEIGGRVTGEADRFPPALRIREFPGKGR